MTVLRPISHEDRLSVIDHLDELRTRLIISVAALLVVFLFCFWQNGPLIDVLNHALPASAKTGIGDQAHQDASEHGAFLDVKAAAEDLKVYIARNPAQRSGLAPVANELLAGANKGIKSTPAQAADQEKPIVFGVSESFTTTLLVAGYFALMITLPLLLYQLYAFVIPALSKDERRIAVPSMIAAPLLFVAGVAFTYFAILPPAVHFLQGYNSTKFQVVVQASSYYKFEVLLMLGIGLAFEVPLLLLALQKVGMITASTLTLNWRYATVLIAVIAAALPGVDPVTMLMETLPLVVLYVASIVLLKFVEHRTARRLAAEARRAPTVSGD
jgi:sec-independent protein translocase protein TatC